MYDCHSTRLDRVFETVFNWPVVAQRTWWAAPRNIKLRVEKKIFFTYSCETKVSRNPVDVSQRSKSNSGRLAGIANTAVSCDTRPLGLGGVNGVGGAFARSSVAEFGRKKSEWLRNILIHTHARAYRISSYIGFTGRLRRRINAFSYTYLPSTEYFTTSVINKTVRYVYKSHCRRTGALSKTRTVVRTHAYRYGYYYNYERAEPGSFSGTAAAPRGPRTISAVLLLVSSTTDIINFRFARALRKRTHYYYYYVCAGPMFITFFA